MTDTDEAQAVGAATLAKFEIVGVIDRAGKVRVLVIDPDRQHMELGLEAPGKLTPVNHRHSPAAGPLA